MEFKLTIDLSPDVKRLLSKLIETGFEDYPAPEIGMKEPKELSPKQTVPASEAVNVSATEKPAKVKKFKTDLVEETKAVTNGEKKWTLEEVRAKATEISNKGANELKAVKELIKKSGAPKLTELNPDKYAEFMTALEELNPII